MNLVSSAWDRLRPGQTFTSFSNQVTFIDLLYKIREEQIDLDELEESRKKRDFVTLKRVLFILSVYEENKELLLTLIRNPWRNLIVKKGERGVDVQVAWLVRGKK